MTSAFSSIELEALRRKGIDPDLLEGLTASGAISRVKGLTYEVTCTRPDGSTVAHFWLAGDGPRPWDEGERPGGWWPLGKEGSTAIIVVGIQNGLALASLLFHADQDGKLWRRPNLPGLLAGAVVCVLPETAPSTPLEWFADKGAPAQHSSELIESTCDLAVIAIAGTPSDFPLTGIVADEFAADLQDLSAEDGVTVVNLPIPPDWSLADVLASAGLRGHAKPAGLAALLEVCSQVALRHPLRDEAG